MRTVAFCAILVLGARPVADSRYRPPLERFGALVQELFSEVGMPAPLVLPVDIPLYGYRGVPLGTVQKQRMNGAGVEYIMLVRLFFLAEEGEDAWRGGIGHEMCHILLGHFTDELALSNRAEREAEQCTYDRNTDAAYYAWVRAAWRRQPIVALFTQYDEPTFRETVVELLDIRVRDP